MPKSRGSGTATETPPAKTPLKNIRRGSTERLMRDMDRLLQLAGLDEAIRVAADEVDEQLVRAVAVGDELRGEGIERGGIPIRGCPALRVRIILGDEARTRESVVAQGGPERGEVFERRTVECSGRVD